MMIEIGFLTSDLFFPMKIKPVVERYGAKMRLASDFGQLAGKVESVDKCNLIFIDLTTATGLDELSQQSISELFPTAKTIAFGPHVDRDALGAAAGKFDEVIPRSKFDASFQSLIAQTCESPL